MSVTETLAYNANLCRAFTAVTLRGEWLSELSDENDRILEVSLEPTLRSLILKRFRSIPAETVTFDNPTFLVGQNGSGKSNFVDAFAFLAEAIASPLQGVFDRRGGISPVRNRSSGQSYPPNLGLGVTFGAINGDSWGP